MMINMSVEENTHEDDLPISDVLDVLVDHNGNDQHMSYVRMLHETSPDTDSLSIVSDYSVMGLQIKQAITFSDMIMSTYSDLKNPSKSITVVSNNKSDPDMIFRKYNMLSLAMEFSKWKESNVDLSLGESISDSESRQTKEDYVNDTNMVSYSPSILSDFSSMDQYLEAHDEILDCTSEGKNRNTYPKSPLQAHIDQKFEETFSGNKSSSESDLEKDNNFLSTKIVRPAWAQSIFHRETLMKMPKSIRQVAESIRNFDLSKEKYLKMLNLSQLQLIVNGLMTQIEELNECLVGILIIRDELKSEQTSMVVKVEELTIKARSVAHHMNIRGSSMQNSLRSSSNYGIVHRFLSNLKCSPRFTSNRVLSFFTQSNVPKIPPPEFV